jgi:hypothetical protein
MEIRMANYCEKCKQQHHLPDCGNFLFHGQCELCKRLGLTHFNGGCCILNKENASVA